MARAADMINKGWYGLDAAADVSSADARAQPVPASVGKSNGPHLVDLDSTGKYKLVFHGTFGAAVQATIRKGDGVVSALGAMVTMTASSLDTAVVESTDVKTVSAQQGSASANFVEVNECCNFSFLLFRREKKFAATSYRLAAGKSAMSGDILLAPAAPGEIILLELAGSSNAWYILPDCFLAADETVTIPLKRVGTYQEGRKWRSHLTVLAAHGPGRLLASGRGSIARYDLEPGEERAVDRSNIVAWTSSTLFEYKPAPPGPPPKHTWPFTALLEQRFMCVFTGPGTVYIQTRSMQGQATLIKPYLDPGPPPHT